MRTTRRHRAVFAAFLGMFLLAASALAAETGGMRSVFEMGASTRYLGMGGAGVAVADEGTAFLCNPAALAGLRQREVSTLHSNLFVDTSYDALSYSHPLGRVGLALSLARSATGDIRRTRDSVVPLYTFDAEQWQGTMGAGLDVWRGLQVGGLVKFRRQSIDDKADSGMGIDAGILYRLAREGGDLTRFGYRNLSVGFSAANALSPEIHLDRSSDRPPLLLRPALAYRYLTPSMGGAFWATLEGDLVRGGGGLVRGGIEYAWRQRFLARGGWDGDGPAAGGGVAFRGFRFDYGFTSRELGSSHRFSLSYRFGTVADSRQSQRILTLKTIARTYDDAGEYRQAVASWRKVLDVAPSDPDAVAGIQAAESRRQDAVRSRLEKARKALSANDIPAAVPELTYVLGVDPGNDEAEKLMGQVDKRMLISQNYLQGLEAFQAGDFTAAVRFFEMVRVIDPMYRDTARLYGEAKSHLAPLDSLPPEVTRLYAAGVNHYIRGEYEQAIAVWQKVLERVPGHYLVQRNITEARDRLKTRGNNVPRKSKEDTR